MPLFEVATIYGVQREADNLQSVPELSFDLYGISLICTKFHDFIIFGINFICICCTSIDVKLYAY